MAEKNAHALSARAARSRLADENGRLVSLPHEPESYCLERRGNGPVCFLGIGPNAAAAARAAARLLGLEAGSLFAPAGRDIVWLEAPAAPAAIAPPPETPGRWRRLEGASAVPADAALIFYRPGLKLFPSFWAPTLAALRARPLKKAPARGKAVLLPGGAGDLLLAELASAIAGHGLQPLVTPADGLLAALPALLDQEPALLLSVNARGLDSQGLAFHTLRALGIGVHIWCVDNPWHLFSAFRAPWWKEAELWVTDASFLPSLHAAGAERARHLPLAAWPEGFAKAPPLQTEPPLGEVVFVGRSAFPNKSSYFAAQSVPPALLDKALSLLGTVTPPDFAWWLRARGIHQPWPGTAARAAGLGAEECSLALRRACLAACLEQGRSLTVFGDAAWRDLLPPGADVRPPVDYYGMLPSLYAAARYSLNVTSLLLPAGLTQRHFDVWAAGGVCLTNRTPGLDLFPEDLVRPVAFTHPDELDRLLNSLETGNRAAFIADWQRELFQKHTYAHRLAAILAAAGQ